MHDRFFLWSKRGICFLILAMGASPVTGHPQTPQNFKVAFVGDQGHSSGTQKVLQLIKRDTTDLLILLGDFDYGDSPSNWESTLDAALGSDFPILACIGNHDTRKWGGSRGYQQRLIDRCQRLGISWTGELGVQCAVHYNGLFLLFTAPGITGTGHAQFIHDQLAQDQSLWRISAWHKNQNRMQVGGKPDETGWNVYEESRRGGAIIATAHEHSYSRTYLLSDMQNQIVASRSDTLVLTKGKTFAFVSGLGGRSIRNQDRNDDWWASIYTSDQNATYGALFGVFNYKGVPNLAHFYFKNINDEIIDEFWVISHVLEPVTVEEDGQANIVRAFRLEQNYPNPFNPRTAIRFSVPQTMQVRLDIFDIRGRRVRKLYQGVVDAGAHQLTWDGRDESGKTAASGVYVYRLRAGRLVQSRKLMLAR